MVLKQRAKQNQSVSNLSALGFKTPMDVIDILAILKIDGEPVIKDDRAFLDPKLKVKEVMSYFKEKFNVKPDELPYLASAIKDEMKKGAKN